MLSKPILKHSHISNMIAEKSHHSFNNPEKYTGKNQEVLQVFIRSCEHLFTLQPITYCEDQQRIMFFFYLILTLRVAFQPCRSSS